MFGFLHTLFTWGGADVVVPADAIVSRTGAGVRLRDRSFVVPRYAGDTLVLSRTGDTVILRDGSLVRARDADGVPANAVTYGGEALTYDGETLTYNGE